MALLKIRAEITNREWVEFSFDIDPAGLIKNASWLSNGCAGLLEAAEGLTQKAKNAKKDGLQWPGSQHWDLLIQEVILKLKGQFALPYKDEELCHCRKIPTQKVDQAIVLGAHTPEKVKAWTQASSGCGTCRPDVESLIQYRLRKT